MPQKRVRLQRRRISLQRRKKPGYKEMYLDACEDADDLKMALQYQQEVVSKSIAKLAKCDPAFQLLCEALTKARKESRKEYEEELWSNLLSYLLTGSLPPFVLNVWKRREERAQQKS